FLLRYGLDGRDDREVVLCQLADNLEGAKCPIGRGPLGVCVETLANESLVDANQRLRAENERLRADLARVAEPYGAWPFSPACQEARAEIERLKEEVAKWQGKVARAKVEMAYD
ncbi:MAG TPA: hypothetical protein VMZ31_05375, partial [Phycisphaerae bacterium]|nr:hypothetical protein [Phycisphaerae bacterium]